MKVVFHNFWPEFENPKIFLDLFEKVFKEPCQVGTLKDGDILCESISFNTTKSLVNKKKWFLTVFYTGESYILDNTNYSIILGYGNTQGNSILFPYYVLHLYGKGESIPQRVIDKVPEKDMIINISNQRYSDRIKIIKLFEDLGFFSIDFGGKYKRNVDTFKDISFDSKEYIKELSKYKYIFAAENTFKETYITEKICNAFLAGIIPIYFGAPDINKHFNKDRFLNVTDEDFLEKFIEIHSSPEKYLEMVNKPIMNKLVTLDDVANDIYNYLCN
jgi:hypothetical protein